MGFDDGAGAWGRQSPQIKIGEEREWSFNGCAGEGGT
jgi:hypothetical protein